MKVVLDVLENKALEENDLIIYKNNVWIVASKESFLANQNKKILLLQNEIKDLKETIKNLAQIVKEINNEKN